MARKGQFKKGGGRVGEGRARKARSKAMVRTRTRTITKTRYRTRKGTMRKRSRSRRSGGGGVNLLHLGLAAGGLAFLTGAKSPVPKVKEMAAKIPGAKTFGIPAAVGVGALAVDRWLWRNKWLKLAGIAGVILAATKVGDQGTDFKWVGDDDDIIADIGDDDEDLDDDEIGDDNLDY